MGAVARHTMLLIAVLISAPWAASAVAPRALLQLPLGQQSPIPSQTGPANVDLTNSQGIPQRMVPATWVLPNIPGVMDQAQAQPQEQQQPQAQQSQTQPGLMQPAQMQSAQAQQPAQMQQLAQAQQQQPAQAQQQQPAQALPGQVQQGQGQAAQMDPNVAAATAMAGAAIDSQGNPMMPTQVQLAAQSMGTPATQAGVYEPLGTVPGGGDGLQLGADPSAQVQPAGPGNFAPLSFPGISAPAPEQSAANSAPAPAPEQMLSDDGAAPGPEEGTTASSSDLTQLKKLMNGIRSDKFSKTRDQTNAETDIVVYGALVASTVGFIVMVMVAICSRMREWYFGPVRGKMVFD